MSTERWSQINELFSSAIALQPHERQSFLENNCPPDPSLRAEVASLIAAHSQASSFLETPVLNQASGTAKAKRFESVEGRSIGPYQLNRMIASGGMGVVYEAKQQHPRREVALKVVRGGQPVDEHRVRLFQREVQALAQLKHPFIGAVYNAGCTDDGQHYFAMELVQGEPLNDYVRCQQLSDRQRLELFGKICDAVSYAHQKGVIHRDLKPANIIITADGDPKILDFGLARITDADVTLTTIVSERGQILGTLPYMSPEQARGIPEDIDVRSDVYSLGIILYELMTGQLPYEVNRVMPHEAIRVICEEPPQKPSTIKRTLRGDLETIVLKALEKEPPRRYQSVSALADDVEHYLSGHAILARPPSTMYQFRKLVARHKAPFAFVAALFILISGFAVWMSFLYANAETEAEKARQIQTFLQDMLASIDPNRAKGVDVTVLEILDEAAVRVETEFPDHPLVEAALRDTIGNTYLSLGKHDAAERHFQTALDIRQHHFGDEHLEVRNSLINLARLLQYRGDYSQAEQLFQQALMMAQNLFGDEHLEVAETLNGLAWMHQEAGHFEEAESLFQRSLEMRRRLLGQEHSYVAESLSYLANLRRAMGKYEEAETLYRKSLEMFRESLGDESLEVTEVMRILAGVLYRQDNYAAAEGLLREALEIRRDLLGEEHRLVADMVNDLAALMRTIGNYEEAKMLHRQALEMHRKFLGDQHREVTYARLNLASVYMEEGDPESAEPLFREVLVTRRKSFPEGDWRIAYAQSVLGECLAAQERYREAEPLLLESLELTKNNPDERDWRTRQVLERIIGLYEAWERSDEAARYRDMLSQLNEPAESATP